MCRNTDLCSNLLRTRGARGEANLTRTLRLRGDATQPTQLRQRLRTRSAVRPTKTVSLHFLCGSSPDPSAARRNDMERKRFCRSGSLQSLKNDSLNKFVAHATPLVVSPFLSRTGATSVRARFIKRPLTARTLRMGRSQARDAYSVFSRSLSGFVQTLMQITVQPNDC